MSVKGYEQIERGDLDPKLSKVLNIFSVLGIDIGALSVCVPILLA